MTALKIKVKKAKMVRKIEGAKVTGFYGRVVSTGKKTFEEVAKESATSRAVAVRTRAGSWNRRPLNIEH